MEARKFKAYVRQGNLGITIPRRTYSNYELDNISKTQIAIERWRRFRILKVMALLYRFVYNLFGLDLTRPLDLRHLVPRGGAHVVPNFRASTSRYKKKAATS